MSNISKYNVLPTNTAPLNEGDLAFLLNGSGYILTKTKTWVEITNGIKVTQVDKDNWYDAYNKRHTHPNKDVLDIITLQSIDEWDTAYSQRHTHANKDVLDTISSTDITNWNSGIRFKGALGASDNLDNFKTNGVWNQPSNSNATTANKYPDVFAGNLFVWGDGSTHIVQEYVTYSARNDNFRRYFYAGAWSDWTKSWDSNDFGYDVINNWNTAFGWGNHALAGYLTNTTGDQRYLRLVGGTMTGDINTNSKIVFTASAKINEITSAGWKLTNTVNSQVFTTDFINDTLWGIRNGTNTVLTKDTANNSITLGSSTNTPLIKLLFANATTPVDTIVSDSSGTLSKVVGLPITTQYLINKLTTDLSNLSTDGVHFNSINSSTANRPVNFTSGTSITLNNDADSGSQLLFGTTSADPSVYFRQKFGGVFGSYYRLATTNDLDNLSGNFITKNQNVLPSNSLWNVTKGTSGVGVITNTGNIGIFNNGISAQTLDYNTLGTLRIESGTSTKNPAITFLKTGVQLANLVYNGSQDFFFNNSDNSATYYTNALGYKKTGSTDSYFLLGGGGHILRSTYLTKPETDALYFPKLNSVGTTIDLNTLTLEGVYYGNLWVNAPGTNQNYIGIVKVLRYSNDWIRQEFSRIDGSGITYVRDRINGTTWASWQTIVTMNNLTSGFVPYTGATSDLVLADKNLNFTNGAISKFENGMRVFNKVFHKYNNNVAQTGILCFKVPQATTAPTFLDVTIKLYDYSRSYLGNVRISFYKISNTTINTGGIKALFDVTENFPTNIVNVGIDLAGNVSINLGEITTVWGNYTNLEIERVQSSITGVNFDWSKGWSQTIETTNPVVPDTYQSIVAIPVDVSATKNWVNSQLPIQPNSLGTSDLNTILTAGFYNQIANGNATLARNYPALFGGSLNVYRSITGGVVQEYTLYHTAVTYKRVYNSVLWTSWTQLIDSINGGTVNGNLNVVNNSTVLGSNIASGTIPASGSAVSTHNNVMTNQNQNYGLAFGSLTTGVQYIQATRFDGTATNYELRLNPNGGTVSFGGAINVNGAINSTSSELTVQRQGVNKIRTGGTNGDSLILSSTSAIYLRPQGDAVNTGEILINSSGTIITQFHGNSSQWYNVSQEFITNPFFSRNSIISRNINSVLTTTLDAELPNGGFITSYFSSSWAGSDRPNGASYGGYIKFKSQGSVGFPIDLDLYYNNGHGGADSHRLWFRTKNSTVGTTNWFEVATQEWANTQFAGTNSAMFENNSRPASADFNTYKTQGFYAMGASLTNKPLGSGDYGNLLVTQSMSDRFMQMYFDQNSNNVYFRNGTGQTTAWGSWRLVADRDWVNTQLTNFVTLNGVQTFTGINTFTNPVNIANGTSTQHAINLGQMNDYIDNASGQILGYVSSNYIPKTEKGSANGVATLDSNGLIPSAQLPSYVDDVLEFTSLSAFPTTGETGKIYVDTNTNLTYRWSGTAYIQIASGAVQSVNGQIGFVNLTYSNVGAEQAFTKNSAFNKNFGISVGTVAQGSDSRIINGQTAYDFTSTWATNNPDLVAIEALVGVDGYLRKDGNGQWSLTQSPIGDATSSNAGKVKLFSDTVQSVASNAVTTTAGKTYGIQFNTSGQLVVNVPWTDTSVSYTAGNGLTLTGTVFSLPVTVSGSGNYITDVTQNANGITVTKGTLPSYTLPTATSVILGGVKLFSDTVQSVASNAVTSTAGRTYGTQLNASGQLVVNVPWVDTNTTYTAGTGLTLTSTSFSVNYGTTAGTSAQGNDSRILNGQTAFGWDNHANAGYAKLASTQTFAGTNTFSVSPVIPNATLPIHPVNLGQLSGILVNGKYVKADANDMIPAKGFINTDYNNPDYVLLSDGGVAHKSQFGGTTVKYIEISNGDDFTPTEDGTHYDVFARGGMKLYLNSGTASYLGQVVTVYNNTSAQLQVWKDGNNVATINGNKTTRFIKTGLGWQMTDVGTSQFI